VPVGGVSMAADSNQGEPSRSSSGARHYRPKARYQELSFWRVAQGRPGEIGRGLIIQHRDRDRDAKSRWNRSGRREALGALYGTDDREGAGLYVIAWHGGRRIAALHSVGRRSHGHRIRHTTSLRRCIKSTADESDDGKDREEASYG
jgi:hypothetical protein